MDSRTALVTLARFAQGQWGMVTSAQAVEAGVSYMQLKRMTEAGLLEKAGQGVYLMIGGQAAAARHRAVKGAWLRMDPAVPAWGRPLLGPNSAIVSHRSAAMLLQLGDLVVRDMEFTTPRRRTSRDQMVRLRVGTLAPYEVTWADGLPVTTALRTLTDLLADGAEAGEAGGFLAEALDRRMLRVENVIPELARFAHRYGCPDGDGQALVRALIDQAAATQPGLWDRERAVSDLARELLRLSNDQLRSLRSLAGAAREPAIVALLSRLASDREDTGRKNTGRQKKARQNTGREAGGGKGGGGQEGRPGRWGAAGSAGAGGRAPGSPAGRSRAKAPASSS